MHQLTIWTAFHAEGLGCNLQHYNPVIDEKVTKQWGLDENWSLDAQVRKISYIPSPVLVQNLMVELLPWNILPSVS